MIRTFLLEAFDASPLKAPFEGCLPEREVRGKGQGPYRLDLLQLASFLQGHDCLADLDQFRKDPSLTEVMHGETAAPRTMGDFLRLAIDSTSHVQRGEKMEGLAFNYKDEWCLDSQVIFDELGFCWDLELRSGNTKSGVGAGGQIRRALSAYKFSDEKYISADAAYCNSRPTTHTAD